MTQNGYSFQFVGADTVGADQYLQDTLVYTFRSEKSGHRYQVNIERYADSRDRQTVTTRRFRIYATFVNNLNLTHLFRIIELKDQSMIVLLNRKGVPDVDSYMQRILDFVL